MPSLLVIGPFPPPVHGLAAITAAFAENAAQELTVERIDMAVSPKWPGLVFHPLRLFRCAVGCVAILRFRARGGGAVYIACNGGLGLFYSAAQVLVARFTRAPVFVHHHSFQYILRKSRLMRALVRFGGGRLTHIFLCPRMRAEFDRVYGPTQALILENALFVPDQPQTQTNPAPVLVIGLLSNLCREKGLYSFLALLKRAQETGLELKGVLAGPAFGDDLTAIRNAERASQGRLTYLGPVYGAAKDRFYQAMDVFVFPTDYPTEAQPTVVFEALAHGRTVISRAAGCIAAQLPDSTPPIAQEADFVAQCLARLHRLQGHPELLVKGQTEAHRHFKTLKKKTHTQLSAVLAAMRR